MVIGKTLMEAIKWGVKTTFRKSPSKKQIDAMKDRRKKGEQAQSRGKFNADLMKSIDKRIEKEGRKGDMLQRHIDKVKEAAKKHKGK
jgi:mRNA-degrading endonuclease toxin of MazEF toxin-antitoxin module